MNKSSEFPHSNAAGASALDLACGWMQYLCPQHGLSRLVLRATRIRAPWLKTRQIECFARNFRVDLATAANPELSTYVDFNSFFTRALRPDLLPQPTEDGSLISPVEGAVSQLGQIQAGRIFQAKGRSYSACELLGDDRQRAEPFQNGSFSTIYLSPRNYHRIHMPIAGQLREMIHIPGGLFSVNGRTARAIPRLFARNERVVAIFDTQYGPMAMVLVGALCVGGIEMVWAGSVTPPKGKAIRVSNYPATGADSVHLSQGAEMGRFNMGSTVILLFPKNAVEWKLGLASEQALGLGEKLGTMWI